MSEDQLLQVALKAVQIHSEIHPRPPQVTQQQAADMLGMSRHTVAKMVKAGIIKLNKCGLITVTDVDALLASNYAHSTHKGA